MHNKFVKGIASVLGAALVLGSVVVSAVPANAATSKKGSDGYETTYTAQELKLAEDMFGECTVSNAANGAVSITLPSQYNQVFFNIPDGIVAANWKSVTIQTGDSDTGYTLKLTDKNGTDGAMRGVMADYPSANYISRDASYIDPWGGDPAATEADFDKVLFVDIMNGSEGSNTVTLKSVTFVTEKEVAGVSGGSTDTGSDDANTGSDDANNTPAPSTGNNAPKTGESMNLVLVVSVLGGLLLIAAAGMFLAKQRKSR